MTLKGTVLITGAADGIGRALALEAADRGASVVAIDRADARETVEAVRTRGQRASAYALDITDEHAFAEAAAQILASTDDLNVVVANVGFAVPGLLVEASLDDVAKVLEVNVLGALRTVQAFLPRLRETASTSGQARLVITGSEHSLGIPSGQVIGPYTVAKHALLGVAGALREQLAGEGISVSLLAPGWTLTKGVERYLDSDPSAAERILPIAQTPEKVAAIAWDSIEAGHFIIPTNPQSHLIVQERIDELQRGFAALQ